MTNARNKGFFFKANEAEIKAIERGAKNAGIGKTTFARKAALALASFHDKGE